MHITKVELRNFKRFTDLTIDGIPPTAKLVLLIGSNGSGKSSVLDAFQYVSTQVATPHLKKRSDIYFAPLNNALLQHSYLKK